MELENNTYIYCSTHKVCIVLAELETHDTPECELLIRKYVIHQRIKKRYQWMAKSLTVNPDMEIFSPAPPVSSPKRDGIVFIKSEELRIKTVNLCRKL